MSNLHQESSVSTVCWLLKAKFIEQQT